MRINKTKLAISLLALAMIFLPQPAWSQAGDELVTLIGEKELNYAQAARFILEAADVAALSDPEEAFRFAQDRKWLPVGVAADEAGQLRNISLLVMRAFGIKGGFLYSLFPNAHYAYRELLYKQVIQDRSDPEMTIPGEWLVFMTSRVLALQEQETARQ